MAKTQTKSGPTAPRFVRAANLELDHRQSRALESYMLTSGARRVLDRIAPSLIDAAAPRAWTLTGPYGSGKSSFAVFAAQLLSPKSASSAQARAILRDGDEGLFEKIPTYSKEFRGLVPVAVTGSREPIQVALLRGLKTALTGLDGTNHAALARRVNKLLHQAESADGLIDRDVLDAVSATAEAASGSGGASGLFVIIDELGKLLEFAAAHPNRSDLYILQHLAELAARSDVPILILTILHKDFSGYADRLSSHEKAEWEKVRGRFEDIVFEESADEVLRLIALARSSAATGAGLFMAMLPDRELREFEELASQAWRLHLAPLGMAKPEFVSLLKQCWPLHPLVAVLAGPVFRKLSQNERSVFSFLSSREPHGLLDFLSSHRGPSAFYGLDRLYDYLWNSLGEGLYSQRHGKKWAEVESALERLPDATPAAISVLKMIGVISAIGGTKNIQATPDVIKFGATGVIDPTDVSAAIKLLEGASVITVRKYNNTLSLWEGSDVDIDERVKVARERGDIASTQATLASRYIPLRPIVARRHSFDTGTLRYFTLDFVEPTLVATEAAKAFEADGRVLVVLPANAEERAMVEQVAKDESLAKQNQVLIALPDESRNIDMVLRELACLEWVRDNTPQLAGDLTARRELRARVTDVHRQLDVLAANMLFPATNSEMACAWFHSGRKILVTSRRTLNDHLSETCKKVFSATPRISNELVNRRDLSSAAAAARRNLIQFMIERGSQPSLGIEGFPPEKSMYLSVLAAHGLHRQRDEGWEFGPPREDGDPGMLKVWNAMQAFFDSTVKQPRTVESLFSDLRREPYGLRDGVLPILLCAALIANESDVALYEEGTFVPQLVVPVFERLMKASSNFTVRRWRISGVRETVFRQLAELLGRTWGSAKITKRNVLDVVRPLLKFVQQLPDYTKSTDQISDDAKRVRAALLQAREPDQLLFAELPQACGLDPIDADANVSDAKLDAFLFELKRSLGELQRHYETTVAALGQALGSVFGIEGVNAVIRERLSARAETVRGWVADPALKNFVTRVLDASADEQAWIESVTALLSERPTRVWRDTDRAKFELALIRLGRMFRHVEVLAESSNGFSNGQTEALRIGVTTRHGGDVEEVVHVGPEDRSKLDEVTRRIRDVIDSTGIGGRKELLLAALARIARAALAEQSDETTIR